MLKIKKILSILLCFSIFSLAISNQTVSAFSSNSIEFILLSEHQITADIGDEVYLFAVTTTGDNVKWKSSDSKIASVDKYGVIKAKKAGTATIIAKLKNAQAYCQITVNQTKISINTTSASLERGEILKLTATTSNHSSVKWKSSKTSIATVDEYGTVTCKKPGETIISATSDGASAVCTLTVKSPTIQLNQSSVQLYRGQKYSLSAKVSSNLAPTWKTNKKSVAIVSPSGTITAVKHGTATISAKVDGVVTTCEVTVLKPDISLSTYECNVKVGSNATIVASVSSGNLPLWSSSNSKVVTIDTYGTVKGVKKGTAYIYASEDGTKVRCTIHVTD